MKMNPDPVQNKEGPITSPHLAVSQYLESLSKSCTASLNARNFSTSAPGWSQTSLRWTAEFDNHVDDGARHSGHNLQTFLQLQRETSEQFPQYHMKITGISSDVEEQKGMGRVFTTLEVTGIPPGVVRQSMVMSEYKLLDGRWLCTRSVGVRGVPHLSD